MSTWRSILSEKMYGNDECLIDLTELSCSGKELDNHNEHVPFLAQTKDYMYFARNSNGKQSITSIKK